MPPRNQDRLRSSPGRFIGKLAVLAMALALPLAAHPQAAAQQGISKTASGFNPHDLSGLWFGGVGGGLRVQGKIAPMTPQEQPRFHANTPQLTNGRTISAAHTFHC